MNKISPAVLPSLAIATTVIVWATAFPAIKLALRDVEALPLASIRYAMAAALALLWFAWKRPGRIPLSDLLLCTAGGIVAGVGYSVLLNFGQQTVSAGAASFLVKTESLWMAALAVLFFKERFTGWAWAGTALCVVGVGIIATAQPGGIHLDAGAPLVLAAAFCSASGFALQRQFVARHGALYVAAVMFIAAALALSPWLPQAQVQMRAASGVTWGWVLFLGLFPTTLGLVCWVYAMGYFGVARAGNFLYLVAPLATLIAWAVAAETPKITTIAGGLVILVGVVIVNTRNRRQAPGEVASPAAATPARSCVDGT